MARILAVEDSPTQARTLRAILESAGFAVTVACDGEEALEQLVGFQFDLMVSDIVMPGIDGYELCQRSKEHDPGLPVVLLTSMTDPLEVVRGLSAGADNFLHKPYDGDQLISRLRTILFNRELRQAGRANMGLELFFLGRRFMITADRQQILDLLVSTFEDLIGVNQQLQARERELAQAHDDVSRRLGDVELERQRLGAVIKGLPHGLVIVDSDGLVVGANDALGRLAGRSAESLLGLKEHDSLSLVDQSGTPLDVAQRPIARAVAGQEDSAQGTAFDLFVEREDGSLVPAIARAAPIRDDRGRIQGAVGLVEDIGGLLAHDPVTGLPGHALFGDRVVHAAELSARHGDAVAVIAFVIDRFERLCHSFAPAARDEIVAEVARRLRAALASGASRDIGPPATYLGNGEFAVVAPELASDMEAVRIGRTIVDALQGPVVVDDVQVTLTVSAGVALPGPDDDPRRFVPLAATTARRASAAGGDSVLAADTSVGHEAAAQLRLEEELRTGIAAGQMVVHYQPQLRLSSRRMVGAEALVRWQHPERGLLAPGQFLELARGAGLLARLSWDVLTQACRRASIWRAELPGAEELIVSVNLSAEQLAQSDVASRVEQILEAADLEPAGLVLEVTESGVLADLDRANDSLRALKAIGVQVALDDFGTGYSSLLHLRKLPVDIIKIDRSFVGGMLDDADDAAIVAGMTQLGHALGLEVIAEGIENEEQLTQVRLVGCDAGQGYYWSPALPPDEFTAWWDKTSAPG